MTTTRFTLLTIAALLLISAPALLLDFARTRDWRAFAVGVTGLVAGVVFLFAGVVGQ